jgi:hypothetical protein
LNGSQNFVSTTNSTALELNSRFSNKFSNNLVIGYTVVDDNRDPIGDRFPSVEIIDGSEQCILELRHFQQQIY